ncbi:glycoside hydrolase family 68 protein [Fictibacillus sp. 7GRE50]|uniref:glycoside hydrolase family 68 protein n=1 Tax=Fictibacillus sp. 7GRE50 TaxID=2745878 RepID=UPI0018CEC577|nr:glycoside hydrolase family 68 protein [Fictibacillus sp. 7GRE50]MBH0164191.1 glycoside hydrolase family 68 protein [Fictibacillus sp. 7GRE50]
MNYRNMAKKVAVVSLSTAILLGGGATTFASGQTPSDFKETYGTSQITRYDMKQMINQHNDPKYTVPKFDASTIKNVESAKKVDENGKKIDMDVWDTWPLQNADGTVAEYKGYHIVFGLAGDPKNPNDTFIYMFYKKADDQSIDAWKNAGRVFEDNDKFKANDKYLKHQSEEWSGSATFTSDGEVRLFYTNREAFKPDQDRFGKQTLTTAQVNLSQPDSKTLEIEGVEDYKSIFEGGDSKMYQTVEKAFGGGDYNDNHTFRDPHYIEEDGRKYLVFEANTGTETGYQGEESLYNQAYYGKSNAFFQDEKKNLLASDKKETAKKANGAIGIIEINDDYSVKKVMKPLIVSNTVTDEIERPNIFKKDGKWYLFTSSRGAKMTIDGIDDRDIYMLGYSADSLDGPFKPLNKTGIVLHQDQDPNDITWTYAHYAIPQENSDNVVVTSYMTNRGFFEDRKSTFAPSFEMNIKGKKTSVVKNSILEQGQLTK